MKQLIIVPAYNEAEALRGAIETLSKVAGLWFRQDKKTGVIRMLTTEEYQKGLIIFREDITRVFTLLHPNAVSSATAIQDLYGSRVIVSLGSAPDVSGTSTGGGGAAAGSGGGRGGQDGRSPFGRKIESSLSSTQIDAIESLQSGQERGEGKSGEDQNISDVVLQAVTQEEAPIFVTVNQTHNLVIVRASDVRVMKEIEHLITTIDRPTPQVMLEMKILQMTLGDDFRSVFDFSGAVGPTTGGPLTDQALNPLQPDGAGMAGVLGLGNFPLEGGTLVYQFLNNQISARVQLFEEDKRVDTIATPMVLASNFRESRLFIGEERVLVTGVSTQTVTPATGAAFTVIQPQTEIRNIGTTITITPKINADRTVTLEIVQDSSTVLPKSSSIPVPKEGGGIDSFFIDSVNTANIEGTVVAKDGLIVAIGGMIRTEVNDVIRKVPILGSIPILGWLFQRRVEERRASWCY